MNKFQEARNLIEDMHEIVKKTNDPNTSSQQMLKIFLRLVDVGSFFEVLTSDIDKLTAEVEQNYIRRFCTYQVDDDVQVWDEDHWVSGVINEIAITMVGTEPIFLISIFPENYPLTLILLLITHLTRIFLRFGENNGYRYDESGSCSTPKAVGYFLY